MIDVDGSSIWRAPDERYRMVFELPHALRAQIVELPLKLRHTAGLRVQTFPLRAERRAFLSGGRERRAKPCDLAFVGGNPRLQIGVQLAKGPLRRFFCGHEAGRQSCELGRSIDQLGLESLDDARMRGNALVHRGRGRHSLLLEGAAACVQLPQAFVRFFSEGLERGRECHLFALEPPGSFLPLAFEGCSRLPFALEVSRELGLATSQVVDLRRPSDEIALRARERLVLRRDLPTECVTLPRGLSQLALELRVAVSGLGQRGGQRLAVLVFRGASSSLRLGELNVAIVARVECLAKPRFEIGLPRARLLGGLRQGRVTLVQLRRQPSQRACLLCVCLLPRTLGSRQRIFDVQTRLSLGLQSMPEVPLTIRCLSGDPLALGDGLGKPRALGPLHVGQAGGGVRDLRDVTLAIVSECGVGFGEPRLERLLPLLRLAPGRVEIGAER